MYLKNSLFTLIECKRGHVYKYWNDENLQREIGVDGICL